MGSHLLSDGQNIEEGKAGVSQPAYTQLRPMKS